MVEFILSLESDAEILREIAIRAFDEDKTMYGSLPPGIETLEWHLEKIKNGMYYKIVQDNTIIGGINLYDLGNRHFRLGALYIDSDYQNQGIGTKAISFIEKTYPHIRKWSLDTPYKSYRNHYFYEKHGYAKTEEFRPVNEVDFWLFEYVKEIS